ncbi:hypothetical protein JHK82_035491 [Glycine max]|nr:hypothetical protein JHK87_035417 [Glycine soja]KAG5112222.1 hypothetical protein JHK82_035491 [Glycine max]KHN13251.1 Mitochondrial chaperone BCS1 [Glycine soja]
MSSKESKCGGVQITNFQEHNQFHGTATRKKRGSYIQHVLKEGRAIRHPLKFETLAMDPKKKEEILNDLVKFKTGGEYYAEVGKAWKRGYLLYDPPGTGKSSMIAAMANFMNYDMYHLELTARKKKENEDEEQPENPIMNAEEEEKASKVTLSGLLNFTDGSWSVCGGERIVIFTTNLVEKLDPALIRRGRMDKHIEMSYCGYEAFKVLTKNYLRKQEEDQRRGSKEKDQGGRESVAEENEKEQLAKAGEVKANEKSGEGVKGNDTIH